MNSHKMPTKNPPRQLKLSQLVEFPHVIWSLMYHDLAKKGEDTIMVAKGKKSSASFEFTAVDTFNLLFPVNDWSGLEKRMRKPSAKALENMRQQMMNCRGVNTKCVSEKEGNLTE